MDLGFDTNLIKGKKETFDWTFYNTDVLYENLW